VIKPMNNPHDRFRPVADSLNDPALLSAPATIQSGWPPWDDVQPFGGTERGTISILAAPPGCYKTATMLRLARGFAEGGSRVSWLAGEMQPTALARRLLCQAAGVSTEALYREPRSTRDTARLDYASSLLASMQHRLRIARAPICFDDIDQAAETSDAVFVDYLQLIRHPDGDIRGHELIEEAMSRIAAAGQRTGAVFVLAAAQGRMPTGETRSINNAAKGSSSIEYSADAVYCANGIQSERGSKCVTFRCLKQREGEPISLEVPIDNATGLIAETWNHERSW
jgi:replicative DNA helicase